MEDQWQENERPLNDGKRRSQAMNGHHVCLKSPNAIENAGVGQQVDNHVAPTGTIPLSECSRRIKKSLRRRTPLREAPEDCELISKLFLQRLGEKIGSG